MPLSNVSRCFDDTLARLRQSRHGASLRLPAVRQISETARNLCGDIVEAYSTQVIAGEVGRGGTGQASVDAPLNGTCPTGLLYGRVQSGKTNAMILTAAVAVDNSFRVIVVLTSDITELVIQTVDRFRTVVGPLVYSSDLKNEWQREHGNMRRHLAPNGVIFICAKNGRHLSALIHTLDAIGAGDYPSLIIDDEADQATPDTTAAARALRRPAAPLRASTIHRRTVRNDDPVELGRSLRERLRHNVLLQVTATPNALFLQNTDSPLRPSFTRLLSPGGGYCGGEHFFGRRQVQTPEPPIIHVDENENLQLRAGQPVPPGLRAAALYFLVAATARLLQTGRVEGGMKCLIHTSPRKQNHGIVCDMLRQLTDEMSGNFTAFRAELQTASNELARTLQAPPALNAILTYLEQHLPHRRIILANSEGSYGNFANEYNFIVGGNILGRGLTIDNLIVTYYLRRPITAQMDTMLQHARMYGYRLTLMPYTRVFVPRGLATRFMLIHESETAQRDLVSTQGARHVNVRVAGNLRPTRAGVLVPSMIGSYRGGQQIYPVEPVHAGAVTRRLCRDFDRTIRGAHPARNLIQVDFRLIERIVRQIPIRLQDPGSWNRDKILAALQTIRSDPNNTLAYLWHRDAPARRGPVLSAGIAGQPEVVAARATNAPVLMMFRVAGERQMGWAGIPFWYPTLIFPNQTTVVFNWS
jgi:hypothetical protein